MLHLVNQSPYCLTLCGATLDEVGEDWTDALYEVVESQDGTECPVCLAEAHVILARVEDDEDQRLEVALEAGALHGIEAYNDALGYWQG